MVDYETELAGDPRTPGPQAVQAARTYAHLFFLRQMIPIDFVSEPQRGQIQLRYRDVRQLRPGRFPGLDRICDGILGGGSFLLP